jgi:hemerythrin-like domain-containing protein
MHVALSGDMTTTDGTDGTTGNNGTFVPDPIKDLLLFHRSIRASLETFDRLAAEAETMGRCDPYKAAALYEFFTGPMRWHDVDERETLLRRLARSGDATFRAALDRAAAEHDEVEAAVVDVLDHLQAVAGLAAHTDPILLRNSARRIRAVLEPHLEREERELFPAARKLLTPVARTEMQAELAARRRARETKSF